MRDFSNEIGREAMVDTGAELCCLNSAICQELEKEKLIIAKLGVVGLKAYAALGHSHEKVE